MSNLNQDLVMETTHGRKPKCKTEFKAVLNKVLVSGLVLATILGSTTPAFAMSAGDVVTYNSNTGNITQEYGVTVENSIQNIKATIQAINEFRSNGTITDQKLAELATQLYQLDTAVRASGDGATADVVSIVNEAEKIVYQFDSANAKTAQAAVSVVKLGLGIADTVTVENMKAVPTVTSFSDVKSNHWAYNDIMMIVNKGAVSGTTTPVNGVGTYNPEGKVTLGQFLAISTRLVAKDKIQENNSSHWATPNYVAAIESNLIRSSDFASTPVSLDSNISREDMAYILVNIAKANGETLTVKSGIQNKIKDFNSISPERQNVVLQAYSNGLLAGDNMGKFNPKDTATRAQIAAVFCRVMNYVERPSVSVDNPGTTINNGYVSTAGETKGMLLSAYSRQYDLQALQGVKTGSDSKGVYVTFTAPQLPTEISKDFTFQFVADVNKSNGDYFADTIRVDLKSGESKTIYFVSYSDTGVSKSDIGIMSVGVMINNSSNKHMLIHTVDTGSKTKALETWYDGSKESVAFDSTAIFSGIGK